MRSQRGRSTRFRAISSLCFSWLAPRVPARPTRSWSRFRELLYFVPHGRLSRSSQRGRRHLAFQQSPRLAFSGYPASKSQPTWRRGSSHRAVPSLCFAWLPRHWHSEPTWSETDLLRSSALLFMASSSGLLSQFMITDLLSSPAGRSAYLPHPQRRYPLPAFSPPLLLQPGTSTIQPLSGSWTLFSSFPRVGACDFCFLFPSLFAPNSQPMC